MIGTLVLYGLAFIGALSIMSAVGVLVFTWRLPERTDPGVIDEQRHEYEHAQWRNNVRTVGTGGWSPETADAEVTHIVRVNVDDVYCSNCGQPITFAAPHACIRRSPGGAA